LVFCRLSARMRCPRWYALTQFSLPCGCRSADAVSRCSASSILMLKLVRRCLSASLRLRVLGTPSSQRGCLVGSASSISATLLTSSSAGAAASRSMSLRGGVLPVRVKCCPVLALSLTPAQVARASVGGMALLVPPPVPWAPDTAPVSLSVPSAARICC
jgi:hypothetical protein